MEKTPHQKDVVKDSYR